MADLMANQTTGLGDPVTGALRLVTGAELVLQRVRIRLGTHFGEVLLNQFVGLPFEAWRATKPLDLEAAGAVILAEIGSTPGVIRIISFDKRFDPATRTAAFSGEVEVQDEGDADAVQAAFEVTIGGNYNPIVTTHAATRAIIRGR